MTFPAFVFGCVIGLLLGAVFHLWKGGGFGRVILYYLLGLTGFWAGHYLFNSLAYILIKLGPINLGGAVFGALFFLFAGHWLSQVNIEPAKK